MKRYPSFLAGAATALLVVALTGTALAASGQVTFNFANVALNGETKIAAGSTITAANGQQVPGSILYTDTAGGKTNYLPIRAVSELLNVEIGYDSASKTVCLGQQPTGQAKTSAGSWKQEITDRHIAYVCEVDKGYDAPPSYRPTWTPEGWSLSKINHDTYNCTTAWRYQGTEGRIDFQCGYPSTSYFGCGVSSNAAITSCQKVTVQGYQADYYQDGTNGVLAWEDSAGTLFFFTSKNVSQATLVKVAESVQPSSATVKAHKLDWLPKGYSLMDHYEIADTVQEYWVQNNIALSWMYAASPVGLPAGDGEHVEARGISAQFWAAEEPYSDEDGETSGDPAGAGVTVTSITIPAPKEMNTLAWQDPDTGAYCRLQSIQDKDTMLRIAARVQAAK